MTEQRRVIPLFGNISVTFSSAGVIKYIAFNIPNRLPSVYAETSGSACITLTSIGYSVMSLYASNSLSYDLITQTVSAFFIYKPLLVKLSRIFVLFKSKFLAFRAPFVQDYPTSLQLVNAGLGSTSDPYKADVRINYGSGMSLRIDYGDGSNCEDGDNGAHGDRGNDG